MSSPTPPMTPEERRISLVETVGIIILAVVVIVAMVILMVMHVATAEFTSIVIVLVPVIINAMVTHQKVSKIDAQTNGGLTKRLDSQTADIISAVAALQQYENYPRDAVPTGHVPEHAEGE